MPIRIGIPVQDCSLTFTNGQKLCADDIEEILNFAKAALEQGDTVVNSSNTGLTLEPGRYNTSGNNVNLSSRSGTWRFENVGQNNFVLILNTRLGNRTVTTEDTMASTTGTVTYRQDIKIQLHGHSGNPQVLYDSTVTPPSVYNTGVVMDDSGAITLPLPIPGQGEVWYLTATLTHTVTSGAYQAETIITNTDGLLGLSLKLFTSC